MLPFTNRSNGYTRPQGMTSSTSTDRLQIIEATTPAHFEQAGELMRELMAWDCAQVALLGLDAALVESFYYSQGELQLPGEYAAPDALLLLAVDGGQAAACGAFSKFSPDVCELNRMYVRPAYRGRRLGARILAILLERARQAGYGLIRLETVSFMTSAIAMYQEAGFRVRDPYYEIPGVFREITVFMESAAIRRE